MKRLIYLINGIILSMVITSCVDDLKVGGAFLDKQPGVDVTIDTVFSKSVLAQQFLWNAYSTLYYGLNTDWSAKGNRMGMAVMDGLTDNFQSYLSWGGVYNLYYSGQYNATTENTSNSTKYGYIAPGEWQGIRKAWIFIENVKRVPDMDSITKKRLAAEAKMIIACHYTDMFRNFGGVPILDHAIGVTEDVKQPRATAKQTLDFIVKLCDEALPDLPWSLSAADDPNWDGRFTGASALGLKIRVLLFAASPFLNSDQPYYTGGSDAVDKHLVWFGSYDPTMWTNVVTACDQFFKLNAQDPNGGYALVSGDPRLSFRSAYYKRGNGELLISTRVRATVPTNVWDGSYYCLQSIGYYGAAVPTLDYTNEFGMADGTNFDASVWDKDTLVYSIGTNGDTIFKDPFANRDPRLYETCLVNNVDYQGRKSELWMGGRERGTATESGAAATGFKDYKFIMDMTTGTSLGAPAEWPYLRLAEIYLSYAEALSQSGRLDDAFQYVDAVRARAGLAGLKDSNPGVVWNKDNFLEAVLKERSCEFGLEDVRWYDIVRWKRAQDLRKSLYGIRIYRVMRHGAVVPNLFSYKKFKLQSRYLEDSSNGTVNFDPKWYLSAFPPNEVYKNYGLIQNPGW